MKEEIRVVDFSKAANISLGNNCQEDLREVSKEIVECFENIGFAYVKNHGIPQEQIDGIFKLSDDFFSLPYEVKKKYNGRTNVYSSGNVEQGRERLNLYSSGYVEPGREIFNKTEHVKELRESFDATHDFGKFAPTEIEGFEQSVQQMIKIVRELLNKLLRCLEIGLDLPFGSLLDMHSKLGTESNISTLRLLHYPPIPFEIPDNCIRCGTHTDYGTITILFQDNIGGLEVKNRNNEWVQAVPVPGTLLINVGDMLQTLTSGKLIATPHRVLIPEEEKRKKCSRKSVVFFSNPDREVVLKPFGAAEDDTISYQTSHDYLYSRLSSTLS